MRTSRLEAFSDGVLAIIITIMVLELHVPDRSDLAALWHTSVPGLLSYLLSFVYVGIYWTNHHHMFQLTRHVTGGVLWADPSGSTMIIVWSEGTTDSGVTVGKTPHFGILSHGRLSQLPLPSIGPHAQSTLLDVSPNIAW